MYLTVDLASPIIGEYLLNSKAKRIVLNHWNRTTINGTEVFDRLYLYQNGSVVEDADHLKLYQLMGIDLDELKNESYDGVDSLWLYFKYVNTINPLDIANQDLFDYAVLSCDTATEYEIVLNYIVAYSKNSVNTPLVGTELETFLLNKFTLPYDEDDFTIIKQGNNPSHFIALQDLENTLFDTTVTIGSTNIRESDEKDDFGIALTNVHTTSIKFTFKRKANTVIGDCTTLFDRIRVYKFVTDDFYNYIDDTDPNGVFISRDVYYDPLSTLNGDSYTPPTGVTTATKKNMYLSVAGFETLRNRDAGKLLKDSIESDYKEEEAYWWEKLLNAVILIIAAVVIVLSGGAAAAGATTALASLTAFATVAATVMTITLISQFAISYLLKATGNYGGAILFGKSMVIVADASKIVGIVALFGGIMRILQEGFTKAILNQAGEEIGRQAMSFGDVGLKILRWLNKGYGYFSNSNGDENQDALDERQAQVDEQEEMVARTPQSMEMMKENFESYYFLDLNEQMQNVPYMLTQGKIDGATTKYYS